MGLDEGPLSWLRLGPSLLLKLLEFLARLGVIGESSEGIVASSYTANDLFHKTSKY